jgi:hypothetical protein
MRLTKSGQPSEAEAENELKSPEEPGAGAARREIARALLPELRPELKVNFKPTTKNWNGGASLFYR